MSLLLAPFAVVLELLLTVGLAITAWKTKSLLITIMLCSQITSAAIIWYWYDDPPEHQATVNTNSKCTSAPPFATCVRDGYEFADVNADCKADLILCDGRGTSTKPQIYLNNDTGWVPSPSY
jgi:hypothetical protein